MKKDIAIVIENLIQFQYIENGINTLLKNNISLDIYVPTSKFVDGFDNIFDNAYNYLSKNNYSPKRTPDNTEYKILLEPYPTDKYFKINHKYRIKYPYSLIAAKPDPSFKPEWNIYYDAILCHSKYEASYLSVYSKTFVLGTLKRKYEKITNNITDKPTLLYLPTYGALSSMDELINIFDSLKSKYHVIIKFHHGTSFLNTEKKRLEKLKSLSDEWYDLNTSLSYLLSKSDVVLSDNSGAIFEALYNGTPIAIFANNINKKLDNFTTIQYDLVESDIIPYTSKSDNIINILDLARSEEYMKKQRQAKCDLFFIEENAEDTFLNIMKSFINDKINKKYKQLHDVLVKDYSEKLKTSNLYTNISVQNKELQEKITTQNNEIQTLKNKDLNSQNRINILNSKIEKQNKMLCEYKNRLLYKIATKIYRIYFKLFKRDN